MSAGKPPELVCPFCIEGIRDLTAWLEEREKTAPAPSEKDPARPAQHTTAIVINVLLERLWKETGGDVAFISHLLMRRLTERAGLGLMFAFHEEGEGDPAPAPTPVEAKDLDERTLAALKDLPQA